MENEIETYEKQKDNRGFFVECDLSNHFYNIHDISGDSLFLKKTTTNIKFEEGNLYIGTRKYKSIDFNEIEELIVIYINEIFRDANQLVATKIYYELSGIVPNSKEKFYIFEKYGTNNMDLILHQHSYKIDKINGVEILICDKGRYSDPDLSFEDNLGIVVSSENQAQLRGWWHINNAIKEI